MSSQSSDRKDNGHSSAPDTAKSAHQQPDLFTYFGQQVLEALPLDVIILEYVPPRDFRIVGGKRDTKLSHILPYDKAIGKTLREISTPKDADYVEELLLTCLRTGEIIRIENSFELAGQVYWMTGIYSPIRNERNEASHILMAWEDITERKLREIKAQKEQQELIELQASQLAELSTPILSISDTTMVMPLVGAIDSNRAQLIFDSLLQGTAQHRASTIILDITGVPIVDTQVANNLVQASQAVRLLGAEVLITGIRPEVAQTIIGLGINLTGITTRGTLRDGIAYALTSNNPESGVNKTKSA